LKTQDALNLAELDSIEPKLSAFESATGLRRAAAAA
jgi:hypothetical protein